MRVTNAATYRNFTASVNNVHLALNKSMNKISSGEAYEKASDAPLAYYEGQKIDSKYQDTLTKTSLIKDISNRIYQQELGTRTIQGIISNAGGAKNQVQFALTDTTSDPALQTTMEDLLQKQQEIVDALNTQYEDYFVFGGNDYKNPPFSLSQTEDGPVLTFTHQFPGDDTVTTIDLTLTKQDDGTYGYETTGDIGIIRKAMAEQGRIDVGYGTIFHHDTLIDTYTGGFNILTGIPSNAVDLDKNKPSDDEIIEALNKSALALVGQATQGISDYLNSSRTQEDNSEMHKLLRQTLTDMTGAEQTLSTAYADLGNKYHLLETTETRLNTKADNLTEQYKNKLGADPYEAIMEMYNNNYSYNAALKVGAQLMSSSLFDFVR